MREWTPEKIRALKGAGKFATLTCYDATCAQLIDACEIPLVLVGDSLGMVMQGQDSTLPVTMDQMVYHTQCVSRVMKRSCVVADMPFLSYQVSDDVGFVNAGRLIQEGGADAVKIEGGARCVALTRRLVEAGIPVVSHLGMTPQSCLMIGGFKVQGKEARAAEQLITDAKALAEAGAFALVLECVPESLAIALTQAVPIPVIGIGAGAGTDGQILVMQDMLGMTQGKRAKFVRNFGEIGTAMREAFGAYAREVAAGTYPAPSETYHG